ncbi:MAG: ThiF family adenylyltransferase [Planctomycetaceae bacterium]|nr:ThiF family adenylyltransferase [Planctomycetaceae bacterium]
MPANSSPRSDRLQLAVVPPCGSVPGGGRLRGLDCRAGGLASSEIVVAGAGAVAGSACESLTRLGCGLLVCDFDRFGPDSFRTQWCDAGDWGRHKVDVLGDRLRRIHPSSRLTMARGYVQDLPWQLLYRSLGLLSAGDNLQMLVWQGKLTAALGKPLFQGAVHGETLSAIVRRWDLSNPDAACPACALGAADWSRLAIRQGCDLRSLHTGGGVATQTPPFVCITAGQMAAAEVAKLLTGVEQSPAALEVLYCLQSHRIIATELQRNPDCRCPHERWEVEILHDSPDQLTLADLLRRSPFHTRTDWRGLEVWSETPWCHFAMCERCDRRLPVRRFAFPGDEVGTCTCGGQLLATPQGLRQAIPAVDLMQRAGTLLSEAGLLSGRAIVIRDGDAPPWCGFVGPVHEFMPDPGGSLCPETTTPALAPAICV